MTPARRLPPALPGRGFTLLEMVVVIAILAILATVAIRSVDSRVDQSRYEATQRQLQEIEDAVLGDRVARQSDGTIVASGFVSDIGRLPKALDEDSDSATPLQPAELWLRPTTLEPFDLRQAITAKISATASLTVSGGVYSVTTLTAGVDLNDASIRVPCGWRGPYLRIAPGQTALKDGWGAPFLLLKPNATDATPLGAEFAQVATLGADGQLGGALYDADLRVFFVDSASTQDRYRIAISGTVETSDIDPSHKISVRLYGPDPLTGKISCFEQQLDPPTAAGTVPFMFPATVITATDTVTVSTVGARVLRAVQNSVRSNIKNIVIGPQSTTTIALKIN